MRCLLLSLMVAVVAGCAVGPRYERPVVHVPSAWRVRSDTTATVADVAWWQLFRDSVLQQLIRTALARNQDLNLAVARVSEAKAYADSARGAQFPRLDGVASYVGSRLAIAGRSMTQQSLTGALLLTYEVDVFARLRQGTRAARAEYRATASERQAVLTTVIGDVAQTYFELLRLDRVAVVSREMVATRRASLALVRRRFAEGLTSELDVRRAEQELEAAEATVPPVERQIAQTENRLSILLGRMPAAVPRGMTLSEQSMPPDIPAGLPSTLLTRRPDLREAEFRLIAANAATRAIFTEFFPRITLTGLYGSQSTELTNLLENSQPVWLFVLLARVPIFHGGSIRASVDAARAREREAGIEYERAVLQAFRDVNDALVFRRTSTEVRTRREAQVAAARRALDLANVRYTEGLGSYLDVLDAERQLFSAELDLASAIADQLTAVVQLYKALGGGWNVRVPGRDPP